MRRQVLYSGSKRNPGAGTDLPRPAPAGEAAPAPSGPSPRWPRVRAFSKRHAGILRFLAGAGCVAVLAGAFLWSQPKPRTLTQEDIDASVLHTLQTKNLPARAAKAAEASAAPRPFLVK